MIGPILRMNTLTPQDGEATRLGNEGDSRHHKQYIVRGFQDRVAARVVEIYAGDRMIARDRISYLADQETVSSTASTIISYDGAGEETQRHTLEEFPIINGFVPGVISSIEVSEENGYQTRVTHYDQCYAPHTGSIREEIRNDAKTVRVFLNGEQIPCFDSHERHLTERLKYLWLKDQDGK